VSEESTPSPAPEATPAVVEQQPKYKVKTRKHKQRACDEKDEKGKLCVGHLKRWYDYPPEVTALVGKHAEVYRCEFCKTIYRPDPHQLPNSLIIRY